MKYKWVIISTLSIVGIYLAWHFTKQYHLLSDYDAKLVGGRIKAITTNDANIEADMQVTNKSDIAVNVESYNIDVLLNGTHISTITSKSIVLVPAKGSATITLFINFSPKVVFKDVLNFNFLSTLITNPSSVQFSLMGAFTISANGIKAENLHIDFSISLDKLKK